MVGWLTLDRRRLGGRSRGTSLAMGLDLDVFLCFFSTGAMEGRNMGYGAEIGLVM